MKHLFYAGCLLLSMIGFSACKTNDPAPTPVVVGTWELNGARLSGFVASYQNYNTLGFDLYYSNAQASKLYIQSDKTFVENIKDNGRIVDLPGTWDYTELTLTLKYNGGSTDTYSYSTNAGIPELTGKPNNITLPGSNSTVAAGQVQLVYRK